MKPLVLPLAGGAAAAALLFSAIPQGAHAQTYPTKTLLRGFTSQQTLSPSGRIPGR